MERAAEGVEAPDGKERQSEIASNGEDVRGGTYRSYYLSILYQNSSQLHTRDNINGQ